MAGVVVSESGVPMVGDKARRPVRKQAPVCVSGPSGSNGKEETNMRAISEETWEELVTGSKREAK